MTQQQEFAKTDIGPPNYWERLPQICKDNYFQWDYHEKVKPGVLKHVGPAGAVYTCRFGSPRLLSTETIRWFAEVADKYCDGHLRFTTRSSVEFMTTEEENVDKIIEEVEAQGFPCGGTGNSLRTLLHTQGWVHCHSACTDASGTTKAVMDELFDYFKRDDLPAQLKISMACCLNMCGAVHCSDIAFVGVHRTIPRVNDEEVANGCEIPNLVACCPTGAIRPNPKKKSVTINEDKCMYCGNCFSVCPALPIADAEHDGVSVYVGGKVSNTRTGPAFSKLVIPYIPNEPPRWPTLVNAIKHLVEVWVEGARPGERYGEWVERIGWEKFFELTGYEFTDKHIDDFTFSVKTFRSTSNFKYTDAVETM